MNLQCVAVTEGKERKRKRKSVCVRKKETSRDSAAKRHVNHWPAFVSWENAFDLTSIAVVDSLKFDPRQDGGMDVIVNDRQPLRHGQKAAKDLRCEG